MITKKPFDIHDRVNYAVTISCLKVDSVEILGAKFRPAVNGGKVLYNFIRRDTNEKK